MSKLDLLIDGMTCAACVRRVETVLKKVPGVNDASVNLAARRASLEIDDQAMAPELEKSIVAAVENAGFVGEVLAPDAAPRSFRDKSTAEMQTLKRLVWIAAILTSPVFVMEMGGHLFAPFHHWVNRVLSPTTQQVVQAVLTTLVLAWPGRHFFTHGLKALFRGQPEMNSLVALGAGSAWLYSIIVVAVPDVIPVSARHVYFEAAAVIVTLILLGRLFEARARGKTGAAIEHLIGLQPKQARLIDRVSQVETDVPIESVKPGDVLRVRPGEKIPVDGHILQGHPFIDQSMITGEPIPAELKPGDSVTAGTINTTVGFTLTATHTGHDTVLARIIRMVQSAQNAKLPIQATVDKVTSVFVPVIIAIALATFVIWYVLTADLSASLVNAVAVLIIACPCAMGLATPTSIMVGTGRAAELGVLFRQGDALQQLKSTSIVAFDKTGTLTKGQPTLTKFELTAQSRFTKAQVLDLVAAIQRQSEHPIARAIVKAADEQQQNLHLAGHPSTNVQGFEAIKGFGVKATVMLEDQVVLVAVGSAALMQQLGLNTADLDEQVSAWAKEGQTPIHVAIDDTLSAIMAVSDPIRPEAKHAIEQLQSRGIECAMITGDHGLTAHAVARELNIGTVRAEVRPDQKASVVKALQALPGQNGEPAIVTFVGDGINDAPALATANVGIAIGTGTDVAIESASVVLMSGQLNQVVTAIDVSRAVLRNIHQNLFWAFAYNTALVPVAAGVLYPINGTLLSPMLAAGAMSLSSLFVVSNALRLRLLKGGE